MRKIRKEDTSLIPGPVALAKGFVFTVDRTMRPDSAAAWSVYFPCITPNTKNTTNFVGFQAKSGRGRTEYHRPDDHSNVWFVLCVHVTAQDHISSAEADGHPVILFDGVCNLCNASVDLVMRNDSAAVFRFASLQSEAADRLLEPHDVDPAGLGSIILVDGGVYRESAAVLRIARRMDGPWPLLYAFIVVPRFVRDPIYRWIARNRYRWFGKRDTCRIPTPDEKDRFIE